MPKIAYKQINFRDKSLELINKVNEIVGEYDAQNYELTLRQLYYQLVARDIIPNNQRSYDNIGALVNNGRLDRIALNMPQIRKYNPPPNPAKITDSRYGAYVSQHGGKSWELDALDPRVLDDLIDKSIQEHLDKGLYLERERSEKSERDRLLEFARNWED